MKNEFVLSFRFKNENLYSFGNENETGIRFENENGNETHRGNELKMKLKFFVEMNSEAKDYDKKTNIRSHRLHRRHNNGSR